MKHNAPKKKYAMDRKRLSDRLGFIIDCAKELENYYLTQYYDYIRVKKISDLLKKFSVDLTSEKQ